MQKKLIAVAVAGVLGAPAVALAQNATVNIYGRMYMELAQVDQGNSRTSSTSPLVDGQILQTPGSAIGFRGEEKLGGGMSAWFQCETTADYRGFEQDALCGRNSALGLRGGFGNIFIGVWDTPFKRVTDPVGSQETGVFGTAWVLFGSSGTTTGANVNQGVFKRRQGGSINYDTPVFGGFQVSLATTVLNSQTSVLNSATGSKPRVYSISARYNARGLNVYGAYEKHKDITGAAGAGDDTGYALGASYTFAGNIKVGGLYSRQKWQLQDGSAMTEGRVNVWSFGVDAKISGPHGIRANYSSAGDVKGNTVAGLGTAGATRPAAINSGVKGNTGAAVYSIRYVHALSKRTEFVAGYSKVKNDTNARYPLGGLNNNATGNDPSAFAIALDHRF
ncbi:MAG: porin [Betaproteobacteria bacterium]|nr:porin [Betaproteobacteria bacterium]